jgi:hypothetical protein
LLALIAVGLVSIGVAAYLLRGYLPGSQPGLGLPSLLPSFELPSVGASGSPEPKPKTLVALGDIGSCSSKADEAVARLVAELPGTIATLGDTAYETGSDTEFANCFNPAWGRMKPRIHPAVGNHECWRGV